MTVRAILEIQAGPDAGRRLWLSHSGRLTVGRTERADFCFPSDPRMSGVHFAVELRAGVCLVRDLHSRNGTRVDGQPVSETVLHDGATLEAGSTRFVVRLETDAPADGPADSGFTPLANLATSPAVDRTIEAVPVAIVGPPLPAVGLRERAARSGSHQTGQRTVLPGQTPQGQHVLSVLLKRTYDIIPGQPCRRAEKDHKLIAGDVHYADPMNSSVKFESDFVPFKLATDIVFSGCAYAPGGTPTQTLTAALRVGSVEKQVRVIGSRVCKYRPGAAPEFSEPRPFEKMELRYERAYGGVDIHSDPRVPCVYARNHLGRGFAVRNCREAVDNLRLPNIEDPHDPLTPERLCVERFWEWERQPLPAGLGWYSKYWQPRANWAGVLPADRAVERELRAMYAPAVPAGQREQYLQAKLPDMDFRFFNGASPGLTAPYLAGSEVVLLSNLSPEGELLFQLPGERPGIGLDLGDGLQEPEVVLHTVLIRMEERQVDLVWRAATPYAGPDSLPALKKLEVVIA
jgi:hypothetical protein